MIQSNDLTIRSTHTFVTQSTKFRIWVQQQRGQQVSVTPPGLVEIVLIKIGLISAQTKIFIWRSIVIRRFIIEMVSPHIDDCMLVAWWVHRHYW
jgi:hypothetical protein